MKAVVYSQFGKPDVLKLEERKKPVPGPDEILIRIRATTVEHEDPMMRRSPGLNGFFKPKNPVLGMELAGEVEAIGEKVSRFKAGDAVFGNAGLKMGCSAEYICMKETSAIQLKPRNLNFEETVSLNNGALTAYHFLHHKVPLAAGDRILIIGASGSVGSAAVQLAKSLGAEITGVCRTEKIGIVKKLGASSVVDYTKEDLTQLEGEFEVIFDAAGKSAFSKLKHLLTKHGTYLTTFPNPAILLPMIVNAFTKGKKAITGAAGLKGPEKKANDLLRIKELIEAGHLKPVIDRVYKIGEIQQAHEYLENNHKTGSVVIKI